MMILISSQTCGSFVLFESLSWLVFLISQISVLECSGRTFGNSLIMIIVAAIISGFNWSDPSSLCTISLSNCCDYICVYTTKRLNAIHCILLVSYLTNRWVLSLLNDMRLFSILQISILSCFVDLVLRFLILLIQLLCLNLDSKSRLKQIRYNLG